MLKSLKGRVKIDTFVVPAQQNDLETTTYNGQSLLSIFKEAHHWEAELCCLFRGARRHFW